MLAVFNVNVAYDADTFVDGDGIMTLREAVFEANDNPAHDTILFDLPANQDKITLAHGELSITESVTIDTVGQDITIDANNGSRVFTINASSSSGEVKLSGLTITGGDSSLNGGGLYFDSSAFPSGDVTLTPY